MNPIVITEILAELRVLPFFPNDEAVMAALVRMVGQMATTEDQVRWLVARMTNGLYSEWPGPKEMRACFCSRFRPKDGINVHSTVYIDGIPSERQNAPQLPAGGPVALLPAADEVISDPQAQRAIQGLAASLPKMPKAAPGNSQFARQLREIETAPQDRPELPGPTRQVITEADFARVAAERKQGK
jgi:hypothetical protein